MTTIVILTILNSLIYLLTLHQSSKVLADNISIKRNLNKMRREMAFFDRLYGRSMTTLLIFCMKRIEAEAAAKEEFEVAAECKHHIEALKDIQKTLSEPRK